MLRRAVGTPFLTGRAILIPLIVSVARASDTLQSIVGSPFDLRAMRLDALQPGEIVTIGADQWRTFPVIRKNGAIGIESSGVYGYAYRVVT